MPPRYAYWTILIDDKPTAFRARDREELLPTLQQLKRTNPNATMRWFARGKLWDTPEQAQWAARNAPRPADKRGRDWRPGGQHRDPRARFDTKSKPARQTPAAARPSGGMGPPRGPGSASTGSAGRPFQGRRRPSGKPAWQKPRPPAGPAKKSGQGFRKPWEKEPKRREEAPDKPPPPEQIVIKPKPPERG